MMSEITPRLALDMYVLAQGVKTGVYRVCDELFPGWRLPRFETRPFVRAGDEVKAACISQRGSAIQGLLEGLSAPTEIDVLLSPFGVAPAVG